MVGRIPISDVMPLVDAALAQSRQGDQPSLLPAKATVGEPVPVRATVFREGHDQLGAEVVLIAPDGSRRAPVRMTERPPAEPDRYEAWVTPDAPGRWAFEVQAWSNPLKTWMHDAPVKIEAGVDVELMLTEGRLLLGRVQAETTLTVEQRVLLDDAVTAAADPTRAVAARLAALTDPEVVAVLRTHPLRDLLTVAGPYPLYADRERALVGSWYEFFVRSEGAVTDQRTGKLRSGTFATAAERLDAVAAMGFDVLYLPPIHPIGEVNRKGPNNTLAAGPDDVGSPWAIGSRFGGHDAVHPDLGTLADFDAFVARASELGIEVALDLALQAAPDHPWAAGNPEFFTTRADGTIAFAENPPKKYQDIYPMNFDNDPAGIRAEVLRVVRHWMDHGVRIFRVDNPHTKPLEFWAWLLAEVRATDPDVVFLAEAFTRPAMLQGLGAVGFHQSYTYFTWRNAKDELADYLTELATVSDHLVRPNLFVNTPDILHAYLQNGGRPAFEVRAVIAATASPSWGVYAGYELCENVAVRPGSEEYLDSEKYQLRPRDWAAAEADGRTIAPLIAQLNRLRREHPALRQLRNLVVHATDDDAVLCYGKAAAVPDERGGTGFDGVIVVANLDPHGVRETLVHLDQGWLAALGIDDGVPLAVHDEISGQDWTWGRDNYVRLDPSVSPAHVLTFRSTR